MDLREGVAFGMEIDVGCCTNRHGDIGIDIERTPAVDIIADAHHLPIRDACSSKTYALTMLEHLDKPLVAYAEMERITSGVIVVRYDRFFSVYNGAGVGHLNLQVRERFVRLPRLFFLFFNALVDVWPLRPVLRRAGVFRASTYERTYRPQSANG